MQNTYTYTGRNQLKTLVVGGSLVDTYAYDVNGNLRTRTPNNSAGSTYTYDALDRVTHITHSLVSGNRTFDYAYDSVGNRRWTKRDAGTGDVFGYDLNDQVTATKLNIANPDTTAVGLPTITYDANGNRTQFAPYGTTDNYTTNNLNQYSQRNSTTATYGLKGNLNIGFDGSTSYYDPQSRLTTVTKSGTTETFKYDGLNRQVSRTVNGVTAYNVYDGWNLIGEYANSATTPSAGYIYGASGLVKNVIGGNYYYQDASGSTSHLADSTGHLLEWYRYDLQGTPIFYNFANTQQSASAYGVRHLFTGQQWYSELGLYDLRNRFYSPDIGRFLQPDPSGFNGDATNLYRYCGNNPLKASDPTGLNMLHIDGRGYSPLKEGMAERNEDVGGPDLFSRSMVGAGGVYDGFGGGLVHDMGQFSGMYLPGSIGLVGGIGFEHPGGSSNASGSGADYGGSDARVEDGRVIVTGWNDLGGMLNYYQQVLGFHGWSPYSAVGSRDVSIPPHSGPSDPGDLWAQLARYNNAHPAEVESNKQFADAMAKYVGWGSVAGVAGLAAGPFVLPAANGYLTNPVFWNELAAGMLPAGTGAYTSLTNGGQIGQWIQNGWNTVNWFGDNSK